MASFGFTYEDQSKILDDALQVVKVQTYQMRRCLESGKLMDGLKHCSTMLAELRTSALTPKNYYELYMSIFDSMRHMTDFLKEAHLTERHHLADLYELVQYAGNIIPRLYLMITVGSVYMAMTDAPVREILKDMLEMARGVQHPIRGLFLRHYLSQMTKDHLPTIKAHDMDQWVQAAGGTAAEQGLNDVDGPSDLDDPQGSLKDAVQFTLTNFIEMNKLWVRLQHQGHSRDREKREMERKELRTLVGSNLIRLSQMDGMDLPMYQAVILPKILEQVVNCRDVLAQEYLMEAIVQVFEDGFHLGTLTPLLTATAQLHPLVSVKTIVISLLDRIAAYAAREAEDENEQHAGAPAQDDSGQLEEPMASDKPSATVRGIPTDVKLFEVFWKEIVQLIQARTDMTMEDVTALCLSLMKLSLNCYPDRFDYIDQVLDFIAARVDQAKLSPDLHAPSTINNLLALMQGPVDAYESVLDLLRLDHYGVLLDLLTFSTRRTVARSILQRLLQQEAHIHTHTDAMGILGYCQVLIKSPKAFHSSGGGAAGPTGGTMSPRFSDKRYGPGSGRIPSTGLLDDEDYAEDQGLLARLIHLFALTDPEGQLELLVSTQRTLLDSGDFIRFTYPPIVTQALQLLRRLAYGHEGPLEESQATTIFKFVHRVIALLNDRVGGPTSETALRLFLLVGQAADEYGYEEMAYEFFVQAFTVYEENISESRAQFQALNQIIGALYTTRTFDEDNYDTLVRKCIMHSNKLLKRPDQCRAMYMSSHLLWRMGPAEGAEEVDATEATAPSTNASVKLHRNGQKVLETLQKATKLADACLDSVTNVELLVEILDQYVYYFESQVGAIQPSFISGLIHLIHTNISSLESFDASSSAHGHAAANASMTISSSSIIPRDGPQTEYVVGYFQRILRHLENRKRLLEQATADTASPTMAAKGGFGGAGDGDNDAHAMNPFAELNSASSTAGALAQQPDTSENAATGTPPAASNLPDYSQIDTQTGF
ncbi:retromer complex subunit Vps35 [Dimargaris verticillata]|uniref:Vacuolar protein sorting-associated protein 35 n=1 Tax=Dimargaris verticillata TaxID=2761393 RepID=A0A9W8EED8_9FUNG|nr:retromer complex subunit Vps35 [Dimargaris verticillata]